MSINEDTKISVFQGKEVRRIFFSDTWWFSIVDIINVLDVTIDARNYWKVLKNRLNKEGSNQTVTNCNQLKLLAKDGKYRRTDCANIQNILRIIQSIPSKKAEPLKLWLAKVGYERMQEITDPEQSLNRARNNWQKLGRSEKWIQQRMTGQETRNKLTDYWNTHNVKEGEEYAILTNIIHQEWADLTVAEHKKLKGLKTQNLRDHMNEAELIFTALAELSTRQIAESTNVRGFEKNKSPAIKGGRISKNARLALELKTGRKVVNQDNFLPPNNKDKKKLK